MQPVRSEASRIRVAREGGVDVVQFIDRNIIDPATIEQIVSEIGAVVEATPQPKIILDFSHTDHVSSGMAGGLIRLRNMIRTRRGALGIVDNETKQIAEMLGFTPAAQFLVPVDTLDAAQIQIASERGR